MGENALAAYAVGFTTGIAVTALAASYHYVWRNRLVNWGATAAEATAQQARQRVDGPPAAPVTSTTTTTSATTPVPPQGSATTTITTTTGAHQ